MEATRPQPRAKIKSTMDLVRMFDNRVRVVNDPTVWFSPASVPGW
jgi:hypothetical protein